MQLEYIAIRGFRNLHEFEFECGSDMLAVLGRNGAGKSNVLEALLEIFDGLYHQRETGFAYRLRYSRGPDRVEIHSSLDAPVEQREFYVNGERYTGERFYNPKPPEPEVIKGEDGDGEAREPSPLDQGSPFLPSRVFLYRAGRSRSLDELFWPYRRHYRDALQSMGGPAEDDDPLLPQLFRARKEHAELALLLCLCFESASLQGVRGVLEQHLSITRLHSCRLTLSRPTGQGLEWVKEVGGRAGQLLVRLLEKAYYPLEELFEQPTSFDRSEDMQLLHLQLPGKRLQELSRTFYTREGLEVDALFRDLEALITLGVLYDVAVRVEQRGTIVSHHELSEGELQFVTLLGLHLATIQNGSLILLDEPDTHLNPRWAQSFVRWLSGARGEHTLSQLVFATHNPLTISGFEQEQIMLLEGDESDGVKARQPRRSPRGMGVNNILTGDFYALESALDLETQTSLARRRELESRGQKLDAEERAKLEKLQRQHYAQGLFDPDRDPVRRRIERVLVRHPELLREGEPDETDPLVEALLSEFPPPEDS